MRFAPLVLALALVLPACGKPGQGPDETREELLAKSQALLDAITAGDKEVFRRTLEPQGLFTDEEGRVYRGPALIDEISPLPPGYAGKLRMVDPQVRIDGDVGVVSFEIAESLDLFGQRLSTRYHTTHMFRRNGEEWRLLAFHNSVLPSELRPVPVDPVTFDTYAGTYRLSPEVQARVWREGSQLFMQRPDRDREELLPIGNDRFVRPGRRPGRALLPARCRGTRRRPRRSPRQQRPRVAAR